MLEFQHDQADGLRRMMATATPRAISILSASANQNPSRLLTNLGSSMNAYGSNVVVVHASNQTSNTSYAVNNIPALLDVAMGQTLLLNAIQMSAEGFAVAKMTHHDEHNMQLGAFESQQLGFIFEELTHEFDIVLVDAALNDQHLLPLPVLNDNEILIELSSHPESIKNAYSLIKRICSQIGRRSFSIVVDDATEEQASKVFNNIASVAWRYLKIELSFFGAIPEDDHLTRAAILGRSVVDAFPMAVASSAFQKIAKRLDYSIDINDQQPTFQHASII
jgi:flagellar biosynthesis protein FlhG